MLRFCRVLRFLRAAALGISVSAAPSASTVQAQTPETGYYLGLDRTAVVPPEFDATPEAHYDPRFDPPGSATEQPDPQHDEGRDDAYQSTEAEGAVDDADSSSWADPDDVAYALEDAEQQAAEDAYPENPEASSEDGDVRFASEADELGETAIPVGHQGRMLPRLVGRRAPARTLHRGEVRFDSDAYDSLLSAGGIAVLRDSRGHVAGARLLGGHTIGNKGMVEDQLHLSVDLFAARRLGDSRHWVKYGWFLDQDEDFGTTGPQFGMHYVLPNCHAVTLDVAYGFETGDGAGEVRTGTVIDVGPVVVNDAIRSADTLQIRLGTCLCNGVAFGGTLQHLSFADPVGVDGWEAGGYAGLPVGRGATVRFDATSGEFGFRGFASVSWTFGAGRRCCRTNCCCDTFRYMPVNRSVQVRKRMARAMTPM